MPAEIWQATLINGKPCLLLNNRSPLLIYVFEEQAFLREAMSCLGAQGVSDTGAARLMFQTEECERRMWNNPNGGVKTSVCELHIVCPAGS